MNATFSLRSIRTARNKFFDQVGEAANKMMWIDEFAVDRWTNEGGALDGDRHDRKLGSGDHIDRSRPQLGRKSETDDK
jgi:hypothetical protein